MNLIFCGTPEFAASVLRAVVASSHRVVGVLTQPDRPRGRGGNISPSPVALAAEKARLPVITESPSKPETLDRIRAWKPEAALVVAYGRLFRKSFLDLPPLGVLNIHPSLLPRWRGASPIHSALLAGDVKTGVCVMRLVEEMDAGPVYAREEVPIDPDDDRGSLELRLSERGATLALAVLGDLGNAPPVDQVASGITFCPKLTTEDERLRWSETAAQCWNRVRAFSPEPGAWYPLPPSGGREAEVCKVSKAHVDAGGAGAPAGRVLGAGPQRGLLVSCGDGRALNLLKVRPAGKKEQSGLDLLNGKKLKAGDQLSDPPKGGEAGGI